MEGNTFCAFLKRAYDDIVHFRPNMINLPAGRQGKRLVRHLADAFKWLTKTGPNNHFGWYWVIILPALVLQSNDKKAKAELNNLLIKQRLDLVEEGQLNKLLESANTIQKKLNRRPQKPRKTSKANLNSDIINQAQEGNLGAALRLIDPENLGVSQSSNTTFDALRSQFPERKSETTLPAIDPLAAAPLGHITAANVKEAIEKLHGTGGPSHISAKLLKKIIFNQTFRTESRRIIDVFTTIIKLFATKQMAQNDTIPLRASRLIAINKPGGSVRPIKIGEIYKRLMTKVLAREANPYVKLAVGSTQCNGLPGACEASHAALGQRFSEGKCVVIIDAKCAYNNLDRTKALRTAHQIVPEVYPT